MERQTELLLSLGEKKTVDGLYKYIFMDVNNNTYVWKTKRSGITQGLNWVHWSFNVLSVKTVGNGTKVLSINRLACKKQLNFENIQLRLEMSQIENYKNKVGTKIRVRLDGKDYVRVLHYNDTDRQFYVEINSKYYYVGCMTNYNKDVEWHITRLRNR